MKTATSSPYLYYYYHTVEATIQQCDHVGSVQSDTLLRTSCVPDSVYLLNQGGRYLRIMSPY